MVVGGGPTGVEVAAEVHDFLHDDLRRLYPELPPQEVSVTVVNSGEHLLGAYDRQVAEYAERQFQRQGITVELGARVLSVGDGQLEVKSMSTGETRSLAFGTCVWATGVAMHPLVAALKCDLNAPQQQTSLQGLVVDGQLRVKGAPGGSIFALGDCAVAGQEKALARAAELFGGGRVDAEGRMEQDEVVRLFKEVSILFHKRVYTDKRCTLPGAPSRSLPAL